MAIRHDRLGQLWQLPLLLVSLGLFTYAAYLFIDPKPGLTIDQKLDVARQLIKAERSEAAIDRLNHVLDSDKPDRSHEAVVHLLLGTALDQLQQLKHLDLRTYHVQCITQTQLALSDGIKTTSEIERRLGENYEAIDRPAVALEHYRQAMVLDPTHALRLQRKVIDLQISQNMPGAAEASLGTFLQAAELSEGERSWGLCNLAKLLVDRDDATGARKLLNQAVKLDTDPTSAGQINYYLGYCANKLGDPVEAERYLRVARSQLNVEHPLDADAACLLGKIYEDRNEPKIAISFYKDVLLSHPDSPLATSALLGRARCGIFLGDLGPGLSDMHELTRRVGDGANSAQVKYRPEAISALAQGAAVLAARTDFEASLELLGYEQQLEPHPSAAYFGRLSSVFEERAGQLAKTIDAVSGAEKVKRSKDIRDLLTKAGDAAIACSRQLALSDDKEYAQSLWRGIDLYDQAANIPAAIAAMEVFVAERPSDALAPNALLRLGRAYQALGNFDKAIAAFQRNQFRYPNSLAASKSAVPLAQAYIAKGPENFGRAEGVLKSVVENNPLLTPQAEEFKLALFELAKLYYHTERYEPAIVRLEELTARYPDDERIGEVRFLMGDSYRKSAALLDSRTAIASTDPKDARGAMNTAEASTARRERLEKARGMYASVVDLYRTTPPKSELDQMYNKMSHFYEADCLYDMGQYAEAIRLYDAAAFKYQDDPSSLAAYVQIVNAYHALGKPEEAKAANERAKWLLRRMPPEAFSNGAFSMPKEYWENQLKWSGGAGIW